MAQTGVVSYNGVTYSGTGIYSDVNSAALAGQTPVNQPVVFLIGTSVGGAPNQVIRITSQGQAYSTLKNGDLLNAYLFAKRHGAGEVDIYRAQTATQSSLLLYDVSNNPSILLTSNDYGQYTSSFSAGISGTSGALIATFKDAYDGISKTSVALGPALLVTYTGNATTANLTLVKTLTAPTVSTPTSLTTGGTIAASTVVNVIVVARNISGTGPASTAETVTVGSTTSTNSVTATWGAVTGAASYDVYINNAYYSTVTAETVTATFIPTGTAAPPTTTTAGPALLTVLTGQTDSSQNLDISLTNANTNSVSSLAGYLNSQTGYTAVTTAGAGAISASLIDPVTSVSILSSGTTLTSDTGTVLNWFNTLGLVTATQPAGATNPPAVISPQPFTGGSDGTPTTQNWQSAAAALTAANPLLRYPVSLTSSTNYRQTIDAAVEAAALLSSQFFIRAFYGGTTTDTDTIAEQNAAALSSTRAYYAHPDFWDYDANGVYTHFPSYMMASCFAGLAAGNSAQIPLTNQVIQVNAIGALDSNNLPITAQRGLALAQAGVSAVYKAPDGTFRIYQGISTDQIAADQTNTYKVEFSVGNAVDAVRLYVYQELAPNYIGGTDYGAATQAAFLADLNAILQICRDTFKWIAGFVAATQVLAAPTNSTFLVTNAVLYVVNPINGAIVGISLQNPNGGILG